ncbi:M1 family metallopeptidase [soil metagenome]
MAKNRRVGVLIALVLSIAVAGTGAASGGDGTPGAIGLGDSYDPTAGNGGYDVTSYDIVLRWEPTSGTIVATTTMVAVATQDLSAFNVDFVGFDLGVVTVDGVVSKVRRIGDELSIDNATSIPSGTSFTVVIPYQGRPTTAFNGITDVGWRVSGRDVVALGEPEGAKYWYPVNDHPSDKATYTFEVTAPTSLTVAANGHVASRVDNADGTTTWDIVGEGEQVPHATILVIGEYEIIDGGVVDGVTIRHVVSRSLPPADRAALGRTGEFLHELVAYLGPYPFDTYGIVTVGGIFPGGLESQTLTAMSPDLLGYDPIMRHELAHAWFGNAISITTWQDIWLAEGFATFFEAAPDEFADPAPDGDAPGPPPAAPGPNGADIFGPSVYYGGADALAALRQEVGAETFRAIIRIYVATYSGGHATTADFIAVAEQVSGRDLAAFFDEWLYT